MAFLIRNNTNLTGLQARNAFDEAMKYLKKSPLAADIIKDLECSNKLLTVYVGKDTNPLKSNVYAHPPEDSKISAGTIYWDPSVVVKVKDKIYAYKGGKRVRPKVEWVKQHGLWQCCGKTFGTECDVEGEISAPMCLMHEIGHSVQFLSDPVAYAQIKKGVNPWPELSKRKPDLEQLNTEGVEQPIIMELRGKGADEGIRWDYLHTC